MPREIVLGNGNILVNIDKSLSTGDFYYPYVGVENHVMGHKCALGVWIDGCFCWVDEGSWQIIAGYRPFSLVGEATARHGETGLELRVADAVHYEKKYLLKKIWIKNLFHCRRDLRLFFQNDFSLGGSDVGDTALYDPYNGREIGKGLYPGEQPVM